MAKRLVENRHWRKMQCNHVRFIQEDFSCREDRSYGGDTLATQGTVILNCRLNSLCRDLEFHVVDRHVTLLLGLMESLSRNLIQLHSEVHEVDTVDAFRAAILDEYKDLFDCDLGNLPVVYKMKLDPDAISVVRPPRKEPLAINECQKRT